MKDSLLKTDKALSWLLKTLQGSRWSVLWLTLLQSISAVLTTLYPIITLQVLNAVEQGNKQQFIAALGLFITFIVIQLVIWYVLVLYSDYVSFTIGNNIKQFAVNAWLRRPVLHQNQLHTGELMNRLSSDVGTITNGCITIIPNLLSLLVRLIVTGVFLFLLLPQMAYIMFAGGLVMIIGTSVMRKYIKSLHKKVNEKEGEVRSYLQEVFQNPIIIRSFGVEQDVNDKLFGLIKEHRQVFRRRVRLMTTNQLVISILFNLAIIIGTTMASFQIMEGNMAIGTYVAVAQLIAQMRAPLVSLTGFIPKYFTMIASTERVMEISRDSVIQDIEEQALLRTPDSIRFQNIDFKYQTDDADEQVLSSLSLAIIRGRHLGIVGQSGGGKSTFLKLLIGVYRQHAGTVTLDFGKDTSLVTDENIKAYRQLFAYVPQSNALMSGTIRESVAFAAIEAVNDDERLKHALRVACALDFVEKLPQGLDSSLKEAGEGISGGQMQRLAIARAIFSDRPFLVLDEATSALDEKTEKQLLHNLNAMTDKTIILVTHRKEALTICDEVIDFNNMMKEKETYAIS